MSQRYAHPWFYPHCVNGELDWTRRSGVLLQNLATFDADGYALHMRVRRKKGREERLLTLFDTTLFRLVQGMVLELPHPEVTHRIVHRKSDDAGTSRSYRYSRHKQSESVRMCWVIQTSRMKDWIWACPVRSRRTELPVPVMPSQRTSTRLYAAHLHH